jgi:predicted DsbA family dithiol-disulfide isomerase
MTKPVFTIEVVSDVVCPWCYIGKRRLERAMSQLSNVYDFNVTYHPFELNPTIPAEGLNQKQYLANKFDGEDRYNQVTQHVTQIAKEEGLNFNFQAQGVSPNTRILHVIIQHAKQFGLQGAVKEAFMKAYFEDGVNLSDNESILKIAEGVGMLRNTIEPLFDNPAIHESIEKQEKELQALGINGVPFYIINNQFGISGAQSSETFVKALTEIGTKQNNLESKTLNQ